MKTAALCDDLLTTNSPSGLRVTCITRDATQPHSHIYMESPVFTPDSRRFVFQRHLDDGGRQYWLCDLDDGCALRALTDDPNAMGPSVSSDGAWMYYLIDNPQPAAQKPVELRRVSLHDFKTETVMVIDKPLPGCAAIPSKLYVLSTIRGDGGAVAFGGFLGDGVTPNPMWGVFTADIARGEARLVYRSKDVCNPHMQYARTTDPARVNDLLIQENLDVVCAPDGKRTSCSPGCFLRVLRDDGTNHRRVPCGNPPHEIVHGHQEWRGDQDTLIVGIDRYEPGAHTRPVIEASLVPTDIDDDTPPALLPNAERYRNDITRDIDTPMLGHTTIDPTGTRFATDMRDLDAPADTTQLFIGTLDNTSGAAVRLRYLLDPRSNYTSDQATHPHPALSPDGKVLLFNTDYTGMPQAWMVEGFDYP